MFAGRHTGRARSRRILVAFRRVFRRSFVAYGGQSTGGIVLARRIFRRQFPPNAHVGGGLRCTLLIRRMRRRSRDTCGQEAHQLERATGDTRGWPATD